MKFLGFYLTRTDYKGLYHYLDKMVGMLAYANKSLAEENIRLKQELGKLRKINQENQARYRKKRKDTRRKTLRKAKQMAKEMCIEIPIIGNID